jgi:outer membrane autotransporter protein
MVSLVVRRICACNFVVFAALALGGLLTSAGHANAQGTGSITIVKTAVGPDGNFSFASTVAGAASFALATANGSASRTFDKLTPGNYSFTETGLPPEWQLTSLTCTAGRLPTTVDLGSRTANVGLDAGESITCTFTNSFDQTQHRAQTQQIISRFLAHRLSLLLGQGPEEIGFLRRIPNALWGNAAAGGGATQPLSFSGTSTASGDRVDFATSLSQMMQAQADKDAIGSALAYAAKPAKSRINPEPTLNAWIEAHFSAFRSADGGLDNRGHFAVVYAGVDYLVAPNVLVGALVQFDWMKEASNTITSTVDGHGAMGGPYLSLRLTPDIFFDTRFAWGMSNNNVNPFGYYTDSFSTDRWLAHAKLTGNWRSGDFRITPSVAVDYAQERQRDYTDSLGFLIPSQTVSLGRLSFGPEIARRFFAANGMVYEPMASLIGQWDFVKTEVIGLNGLPADSDRLHAKAQVGISARAANGISARVAGTYDGIGNSSFSALGLEFWLSVPLN